MTKPENLIEYMIISHLSSLDFISERLNMVQNSHDISRIGHSIGNHSIARFGFHTHLGYPNLSEPIWRTATAQVFSIARDALFGERVDINIDKYRENVDGLKKKSASFGAITSLIEKFGAVGFYRALSSVADNHNWQRPSELVATSEEEIEHGESNPKEIRVLSQKEISGLVSEISSLRTYVDDSALSQEDRAQAYALIESARILAETPNPPWYLVKEALYLLAALASIFAVAITIADKIF